jgi:nitrogen fixation-related uncharacterized protein
MPRRTRAAFFLLMPIAVFLWFIGWSLLWTGIKREKATSTSKLSDKKDSIIFVPVLEQKQVI